MQAHVIPTFSQSRTYICSLPNQKLNEKTHSILNGQLVDCPPSYSSRLPYLVPNTFSVLFYLFFQSTVAQNTHSPCCMSVNISTLFHIHTYILFPTYDLTYFLLHSPLLMGKRMEEIRKKTTLKPLCKGLAEQIASPPM